MNNDFAKYQTIIDRFRGQVNLPDFESSFANATANIVKTDRFLLKMELKRLANPCTRLIDLRGHVDGECKAFEHEDRIHFLDGIAIKVFKENMAAYGSYTFGVYEAVNNTENNFRVIYQREKSAPTAQIKKPAPSKVQEKTQYPAKFYHFGNYKNRREERMNFAIALTIELSNGTKIEATSSDISISGCKFRFSEPQDIALGQTLLIKFVGLEEEFQFGKVNTFSYEVCNILNEENLQLVGVKRIYTEEKDSFRQFLQGFIQGNKRRYKINLDNTIAALQARSYEHYALPKISELPIFVETNKGQLLPRYALTTNNNQHVYQYWQDEQRNSTLHCLINRDRIERIQKAAKIGRSLLVYSFIHHSNGKFYFYTADEKQLAADKKFMMQFLGFAASKSSFSITELSCYDVDPSSAKSPYTVANVLPKKDEYLNLPPSNDVTGILAKLPFIVVANDITDEKIVSDYQELSYDNINTNKLKSLGHKRLTSPLTVDEIGVNYRNHRQEARFKYKTPVEIELSGVKWRGVSLDFSVSGLKVELEKEAVLAKGDVVYFTFPGLQKVTSAFELKKLPYEVVRINKKKNVINLRVFVEKHQHIGRAFFKLLIEKNKEKLTPDEYAMMTPGLAKAMRNIYSHCVKAHYLFIQTSGSRYKIESLGCTEEQGKLFGKMKELSDRPNHYNLYPLLHNQTATSLMASTLKKLQTSDSPTTDVLYIAVNHEVEMIEKAVTTRLASELQSRKLKKMFIDKALKRGSFFCVQVKLSRTDEPDMEFLNPELSYISSYAIHRGKQIEQDIWSVAGVIQCFDITQEAMYRHQLQSTNEQNLETH